MDKSKKKRLKRYFTWALLASLVALLTVMPLMAKTEAEQEGPQASILSAEAEMADLSTTLHGGGTLASHGAEEVNIPSGVKITGFLVKNGDTVTAGTPVATVDKVSVMMAIQEVSNTMDFLREEMENNKNEKVEASITAPAGGRVKKIFAGEGEDVETVMLRDGCLALLSIDGRMAVKLEAATTIGTGESVTVTRPDGSSLTGRIESNLDGVVIVTVEDEGYPIGEAVTVEGIGSGSLYVHNPWKATGYSGTIDSVRAKEETTVSAGSTLFTLDNREYTATLQHRANQHREYEDLLKRLMQMYESGTIDAPCDGVVSGVEEDSAHLLSAEGAWEAELLEGTGEGWQVILLGASEEFPECTGDETCPAKAGEHQEDCPMECTRMESCKAKEHYADCIRLCIKADSSKSCPAQRHYSDCIKSCTIGTDTKACPGTKHHYANCNALCISSDGPRDCPAQSHKKSCIERCSHADAVGVCEADDHHHYTDCIESCTLSASSSVSCPASKHQDGCFFHGMTYQAIAAKVDSVGNLALVTYASQTIYNVERTASGWAIAGGGEPDETTMIHNTIVPTEKAASFQKGDIILIVTGYKAGEAKWQDVVLYCRSSSSGGFPSMPGFGNIDLSGMIGGFGGFGNYGYTGETQTEEEGLYDLEGSTLLSVTPQDTMTLTIQLDQQDIGKVSVGMEATVKVEALRGEAFAAKVSKVSLAGTSSGGSSKFTVELTMPASPEILYGMSATASIPLETRENVLTIPLEALAGTGDQMMVYTALDPDSGEPASPVQVEIGLSDGALVEILSGLTPGETVYYSYFDVLELDTSAEANRFTFG